MEKFISKQKIKTFLPVFNGFYNSIWDIETSNILYNVNETREENGLPELETDENFDIEYKEYENDIAKGLCECLEGMLSDYVENITFENVYTDSVNCIIIPKPENIKDFIYKNKDAFCEYLKANYTSCDGFWSHYSNDFSDWENDTLTFLNFENNGHILGAILNFICIQTNIDEMTLYSEVMEGIYADNYLKNYAECYENLTCTDCGKFLNIEDGNLVKKYIENTGITPSIVLCEDCAGKLASI